MPQVTTRVFLLCGLLAILAIVTVLADSLFVDLVMVGLGLLATGSMLYRSGQWAVSMTRTRADHRRFGLYRQAPGGRSRQ